MKSRLLGLFALAAIAAVPGVAADEAMLRLVMPGAKLVAGANVDRVVLSPLGQFALNKLQEDDPRLKALMDLTGFDPRRDVREVLVASTGHPRGAGSIAMVRGTFNVAKLSALATLHGGTMTSYEGVPVLTAKGSTEGAPEGWAAVLEGTLLVAGQADDVRAAIDRSRAAAAPDAELAAKVQALSATYDVWGYSAGNPVALVSKDGTQAPPPAGPAQALEAIESVSGGVKLGSIIEIVTEAVTASEKDAQSLSGVVTFLASMAAQQQAEHPVALFLKTVQASAVGVIARVTMSAPEIELEKLLEPRLRLASVR